MLSTIRSPSTLVLMAVLFLAGFWLTRPKAPLSGTVSSVSSALVQQKPFPAPALPSVVRAIAIPAVNEPSIQMTASSETIIPVIPGNEVAIPIGEGAPISNEPPLVEIPAANNEPEFYGEAIPIAPVALAARTDVQSEAQPIVGSAGAGSSSAFPPVLSGVGKPNSALGNTGTAAGASFGTSGAASTSAENSATTLSATDTARIVQPMSAALDLSALDVSAEQCIAGESTCAAPATVSFPRSRWSLTQGILSAATVSAQAIAGAIPVRFAVTFTLQGVSGANTPVSLSLTPNAVNSVPMVTTAQGQQKIYEFDFANTSTSAAGQLKNLHVKLIYVVTQGGAVLQGGSYLQFERTGFESMTTPWSPGGSNPEVTQSVPFIRVASANYRVMLAP